MSTTWTTFCFGYLLEKADVEEFSSMLNLGKLVHAINSLTIVQYIAGIKVGAVSLKPNTSTGN